MAASLDTRIILGQAIFAASILVYWTDLQMNLKWNENALKMNGLRLNSLSLIGNPGTPKL